MKTKKSTHKKNQHKKKYEWDLSVFYSSAKDPQIEKDQQQADNAYAAFVRKYSKNKAHLSQPKALAKALADYEKLAELPADKLGFYAFYRKDLNSEDKEAAALLAKLTERETKRSNSLLFFVLELGKISKTKQQQFLKSPLLEEYRYFLKEVFDDAKYTLSEPEEKILSLKADLSYSRWVQATENILNTKTVSFKKKTLPLPQAEMMMQDLGTRDRRTLHAGILEQYKSVSQVAESELNAIYTNKKINDELRGYKTPDEATIRGNDNDVKSIRALNTAVTDAYRVSHRFYKIKAKLLGLKKLHYADRTAKVGTLGKKIPFDKAFENVREVFDALDPKYVAIIDRLLKNKQIDVYPKQGKSGGAYCAHGVGVPTFVLLNHVDTFESLKTLAHELGHAIHSERSKEQRPLYESYTTSAAETASTFFEYAALHHFVDKLPEEDKIIALHNVIQDDISTVFRQIAVYQFEYELHERIRSEGYLSKEAIAALMNKHMKAYLGPVFELTPDDGYFFVTWSHIRRFFYVYSYAYGQLISKALHSKLEKDASFIHKVDEFLSAGGSSSPEDIFGSIGVNTRKVDVFEEGIKSIERDVKLLEKLVR